MKKLLLIFFASVMCFATADAKKNKPFYGSKSDVIGVSGHTSIVSNYSTKFFVNDVDLSGVTLYTDSKGNINGKRVEQQLNSMGAGLKILKFILDDGNGNISFDRLDQRSLANVSEAEREVAESDQNIESEDRLRENVAPQFRKNYIYFNTVGKKSNRTSWVVLRVDMDESTYEEVCNILAKYWKEDQPVPLSYLNTINPDVKLVATGQYKDRSGLYGQSLREVGKVVGDFAIRGQIVSEYSKEFKNKYAVSIGSSQGVQTLDKVYVYRSIMRRGREVSRLLGAARVVDNGSQEARLCGVAGGWGHEKRGDVGVLHHDKHMASNFMVSYQNKSVGFNYQHDFLRKMNPHGMSRYVLVDFGVTYITTREKDLEKYDKGWVNSSAPYGSLLSDYYLDNWQKPVFIHFGVGYGVSWHFLHMMEFMPYVMFEPELAMGMKELNSKDDVYPTYLAWSFRGKGGAKINFNLDKKERNQFFVGAEYNYNVGLNVEYCVQDDDDDNNSRSRYTAFSPYKWWGKIAKKAGVDRTGLQIYAGYRLNF